MKTDLSMGSLDSSFLLFPNPLLFLLIVCVCVCVPVSTQGLRYA